MIESPAIVPVRNKTFLSVNHFIKTIAILVFSLNTCHVIQLPKLSINDMI